MSLTRKQVYWSIALLAFFYVALRSFLLSFTIDESMTYRFVVGLWEDKNHSNNHFLNTQLMKVCSRLFGNEAWSLRLPNLISFLFYLYAVWRLLRNAYSKYSFLFGIVVLLALPYMLEFFGLARGYGLSIAFSMLGFSYLISGLSEKDSAIDYQKHMILASIYTCLGVASNLSVINVSIALISIIQLHQFIRLRASTELWNWVGFIITALVNFVSLGKGAHMLWRLRGNNDLIFGSDSYEMLGKESASSYIYMASIPTTIGFALLFLMGFILLALVVMSIQERKWFTQASITIGVLLVSMAGWVFEHEVLGANLPLGRTGVIYLPLLGYGMYILVNKASTQTGLLKGVSYLFSMAVIAAYVWNLSLAMNVYKVKTWPEFALLDRYTDEINRIAQNQSEPVIIEKYFLFRYALNYYILEKDINAQVDMDYGIKGEAEFLMVNIQDFVMRFDDPRLNNYVVPEGCEDDHTRLYVRKDIYAKAQ